MGATEQKKDNSGVNAGAGTGMEAGHASGEKKKSGALLFIIGFLVFLLAVAVGGIIGYTRLPVMVGQYAVAGAQSREEKAMKRPEVKSVIPLDPFLVNLADVDDIRFLKATFQLGMADKTKEEANKNSIEAATIRDSIISLLCAKTADQIMTPEGKETLREEIRTLINARSSENKVAEVYIVDFVVQL